MSDVIHHLHTPEPIEGAVNVLPPRRHCKNRDAGVNTEVVADVTCERCLELIRQAAEWQWKYAESARIMAELAEQGYGQDDDPWHERAGEVCAHYTERLHTPMVPAAKVRLYCKITPIPERFRNHGWNLKACIQHEPTMSGYLHADRWVPFDTDPFTMIDIIAAMRRDLAAAVKVGMKIGHESAVKAAEAQTA